MTPYPPQGNGEAERAIGTVKNLKKSKDPYKTLLGYCTMPLQLGYSPSLMGQVLWILFPMTTAQRKPKIPDLTSVRNRDKRNKIRKRSHLRVRQLPLLQLGDHGRIPGREQSRGLVRGGTPVIPRCGRR